ncbi:MAG: hypothetical protein LBV45_02125, partial [Xanthomonadaceae bacterium]|nr:hypothetical protein [Xanthomonadaceae bacterium]
MAASLTMVCPCGPLLGKVAQPLRSNRISDARTQLARGRNRVFLQRIFIDILFIDILGETRLFSADQGYSNGFEQTAYGTFCQNRPAFNR